MSVDKKLFEDKPRELVITRERVSGVISEVDNDLTGVTFIDILDLTTRPQILIHEHSCLLAVFLDEESYQGIIKMIKSLKGGDDFGIIEIAKLWKNLKPFLEKMEIKST